MTLLDQYIRFFFHTSALNFNNPNKKTAFNIDFGDTSWSSTFLTISRSLIKAEGSNINLFDNFIFPRI